MGKSTKASTKSSRPSTHFLSSGKPLTMKEFQENYEAIRKEATYALQHPKPMMGAYGGCGQQFGGYGNVGGYGSMVAPQANYGSQYGSFAQAPMPYSAPMPYGTYGAPNYGTYGTPY